MKKLIAIVLIAVMALGLAACGTVNKTEVSVLWKGDGIVKVPNSLINAVARAMYIENVSYVNYGANGDQSAQTKQAGDALNAGCSALVVELVDVTAAQDIIDIAKAKDVPVIFINCEVDEDVVTGYNKAACIASSLTSISKVQGEQISETLYKDQTGFLDKLFKKEPHIINPDLDRNEDGKITYIAIGDVTATIDAVNAPLIERKLPPLEAAAEAATIETISSLTETVYINADEDEVALLNTVEKTTVELIITDNDTSAKDVLLALQALGFNADRLNTHYIPVYTVGNDFDYKAYVMESIPAAPYPLDTKNDAEIKALNDWWETNADVASWKKANATICDLNAVDWMDLDEFLYCTTDVIGSGRLAGTTMIDYDAIAVAAARTVSSLITGKAVDKQMQYIDYTTN